MARLNVYVPDDLAGAARAAGLNVSALTRRAIADALAARRTDDWLDEVLASRRPDGDGSLDHAAAMAALDASREDLGA